MHKLRVMGLSLVALLSLGAVCSSSAWATSPPENTARPVLVLESLTIESTEFGTKGTWTNEPTAYAFQWQRCNTTGGECVNIAGATTPTYPLVPADHGHTLVYKVTASNSAGEATAYSKPSKVVTPLTLPEFIPANHVYPVSYSFTGGEVSFEAASGLKVACSGGMSGSGTISGPSEIAGASLKLIECNGQGLSCHTLEASGLHGRLGYISQAAKTVGLDLEGSTPFFQTFNCNGWAETVRGHVIGQIGPVNKSRSSFELNYSSIAGVQNPSKFEGGQPQQLEWSLSGNPFEKWAFQGKNTLTTSAAGEIVA